MKYAVPIADAVPTLRTHLARITSGELGLAQGATILAKRDQVLARYQPVFALDALDRLTEEEFRSFLQFRNNQHWMALQRLGPAICADMNRLRQALGILLDESRPVRDRLNELVPAKGSAFVPRLGKAVLTPILLVAHPDRYGVWNSISEAGMKGLDLWPDLDRSQSFGDRYEAVNEILLTTARAVGVDLWTLDTIWWAITATSSDDEAAALTAELPADPPSADLPSAQRFGLERHLHDFLRDNWEHTPLGKEWKLYEEDGDPEAGYEYPCSVGRIDLLARHRSQRRWLVIELKRAQTSDQTIGQLARYIGWVQQHLAEADETVEGLVIAHEADESIRYALAAVPRASIQLYEVEFRLRPAEKLAP